MPRKTKPQPAAPKPAVQVWLKYSGRYEVRLLNAAGLDYTQAQELAKKLGLPRIEDGGDTFD